MFHKFQQLPNTYFASLDNGKIFRKPFKWLYILLAFANVLTPLIIIYQAINNNIFSAPFSLVLGFLLIWVFLVIACAIGALLWWNRKYKVEASSITEDEFIATPIFSHYIQTMGENIATLTAIVGTAFSLIATFFISGDNYLVRQYIPIGSSFGFAGVLIFPIIGFLILVFSRFIAEQIRALASIANNTKAMKMDNIAIEVV